MPVQPDRGRRGRVPLFPVLGLVVGACATLPVLVGPQLATAPMVELAMSRSRPVSGVVMLSAGMVISLAGLWMMATHIPLVAQAARHDAPWGGTVYHSASAVMVLAFGVAWTWGSWSDAG